MKYSLFEVAGIELEYMIVEKQSLEVASIADLVLTDENGVVQSDREFGSITWSNELAAHVVELKTTNPITRIDQTEAEFVANIVRINELLDPHNCMLLPTAVHPFMNPRLEGDLWPHEGSEIYECYRRLFDVHAHGWLNLQSVHLNLPFDGDEEFARLHAAVRMILPFLPVLTASSPVLEGRLTGVEDSRLHQYLLHQLKLKSSMGLVIPEFCSSQSEYLERILKPIELELNTLPGAESLKAEFLNARGAIARFGRGSIEIRVLDISEAPVVDLAICTFIIELVKFLALESPLLHASKSPVSTERLRAQLDAVIQEGREARIIPECLCLYPDGVVVEGSVGELFACYFERFKERIPRRYASVIETILTEGNVARRIIRRLGSDPSRGTIAAVYQELAECLRCNQMFL